MKIQRHFNEVVNRRTEDFLKNNLRLLRKEKGWSQAELGKRLDLAHNTVSLYESGRIPLDREMTETFAKALGVPADAIEVVSEEAALNEAEREYTIPVEVLSSELLDQLVRQLSTRLPETHGQQRAKIIEAIKSATTEQDRRRELERQRASSASIPSEALAGGAAAEAVYERERAQPSPKPGADAPSASKGAQPQGASGGSKAQRPGNPGPARK